MVQREPEKRLTAEEYLKQQRGRAFPDIFYTFLQPYIAQFAKDTFQSADERVLVIRKDLENILQNLRGGELLPDPRPRPPTLLLGKAANKEEPHGHVTFFLFQAPPLPVRRTVMVR